MPSRASPGTMEAWRRVKSRTTEGGGPGRRGNGRGGGFAQLTGAGRGRAGAWARLGVRLFLSPVQQQASDGGRPATSDGWAAESQS